MIKLYGSRPTRSTRAAWMLEELGLQYELIPMFDPRSAEFLAHNPNGKLPTLVDDGFAVWESMAVNFYLAQKYGGPLWPSTFEAQTRASMWSYWAMTELEQPLHAMIGTRRTDPAAAAELEAKVQRPLRVLEAELSKDDHLLGARLHRRGSQRLVRRRVRDATASATLRLPRASTPGNAAAANDPQPSVSRSSR